MFILLLSVASYILYWRPSFGVKYHVMIGSGTPQALQCKTIASPSCAVTLVELELFSEITGGTMKIKSKWCILFGTYSSYEILKLYGNVCNESTM